jgi:hypothetical protein
MLLTGIREYTLCPLPLLAHETKEEAEYDN